MKNVFLLLAFAIITLMHQTAFAQWTTNGTNIYNTNSGRVGVGTTTPAYKLDVNGTLNADTLQNTVVANSSSGIQHIKGGDVEITIDHRNNSALTGAFEIFNGTGAHLLNMWETGVTTLYNSTTIQNPNSSAYSAALTLSGSGIYGSSMMLKNTATSGIDWSIASTSDGSLKFVKVEGSTHTPLRIEPNGRVSLGAQSPVGKLHVQNFYSGNYGGVSFSRAIDGTSNDSIGIHDGVKGQAYGLSSYGVWGVNNHSGGYAGYFNGKLGYTGTLTGPSDRKLKQDIEALPDALARVMRLKPSRYRFNREAYSEMNLPEGDQFGFIAQELAEVFPELVHDAEFHDDEGDVIIGYKSVDYLGLVAVLAGSIQETNQVIGQQKEQIASLEARLAKLEAMMSAAAPDDHSTGYTAVAISGEGQPQLEGNRPNPFNGTTTIPCYLPLHIGTAVLKIFDTTGKEIHQVTIKGRGQQQIELSLEQWVAGQYFYTIVADGTPLPMQKMTLSR